jgi:2-aminomuconate deaminase
VGNLLFLSGVGPRERGARAIPGVELGPDGKILSYDIEAQCHSVFKNVRMILEDAGAQWSDIVDVTVFLTNMKADFATFNRIYGQYFADNQPCRTTIEVGALPTQIAIELKVTATIGRAQSSVGSPKSERKNRIRKRISRIPRGRIHPRKGT